MTSCLPRRPLAAPLAFALALALAGCGDPTSDASSEAPSAAAPASEAPAPPPPAADPPAAWEGLSSRGAYRVRVEPEEPPIPLNRIHRWIAQVEDAEGTPVAVEAMSVGGGMPQHGHGLVTEPVATPEGEGRVVIDGMKFHMSGAWRLDLGLMGPKGFDAISFEIQVGP